jgi:hypothetical protein
MCCDCQPVFESKFRLLGGYFSGNRLGCRAIASSMSDSVLVLILILFPIEAFITAFFGEKD